MASLAESLQKSRTGRAGFPTYEHPFHTVEERDHVRFSEEQPYRADVRGWNPYKRRRLAFGSNPSPKEMPDFRKPVVPDLSMLDKLY